MVKLIIGNKGDGKTKHLLDRVNNQIKTASGNIVYLDKSTKHMHESRIRKPAAHPAREKPSAD